MTAPLSTPRACRYCGATIQLLQAADGQWRCVDEKQYVERGEGMAMGWAAVDGEPVQGKICGPKVGAVVAYLRHICETKGCGT